MGTSVAEHIKNLDRDFHLTQPQRRAERLANAYAVLLRVVERLDQEEKQALYFILDQVPKP